MEMSTRERGFWELYCRAAERVASRKTIFTRTEVINEIIKIDPVNGKTAKSILPELPEVWYKAEPGSSKYIATPFKPN